jgi:hypothetical protein
VKKITSLLRTEYCCITGGAYSVGFVNFKFSVEKIKCVLLYTSLLENYVYFLMQSSRLVCDEVHSVRLMGNLLLPSCNLQMVA